MDQRHVKVLSALLIFTTCPACSDTSEGSLSAGRHDSPVVFQVRNGETFYGNFIMTVGPGNVARFELSGHSDSGHALSGTYVFEPDMLSRTMPEARTFEFAPTSEWDWIYESRGAIGLVTSTTLDCQIRRFRYTEGEDGAITVSLEGITPEQYDREHHTIRPEGSLWVDASGHLTTTCWTYGPLGEILEDPRRTSNPLCVTLFGPAP